MGYGYGNYTKYFNEIRGDVLRDLKLYKIMGLKYFVAYFLSR